MKTLKDTLDEGNKYLQDANIDEWKTDAWYLFSHVLDIDRARYFTHLNELINKNQYNKYINLIEERSNHIPLQHIIGYTEFMGLKIKVNDHVLIPRQDTEVLVEEVLKVSHNKDVLDLCTGSGCIIISLKKLGNINKSLGSDISKDALVLARENAKLNDVDVTFIESDLFNNIEGKFDIIVSNPPYIPSEDIEELSIEVRDYEPIGALDGKSDGLYFYRKIVEEVRSYIKPDGILFFEIGYNQADDLINILMSKGINDIEVIKDLAGHDRVIKAHISNL